MPEHLAKETTVASTVRAVLGNLQAFHSQLLAGLEHAGIDVSSYPVSHVAYRCPSWSDYLVRRKTLEVVCSANVESLWSGRPISKLLLARPVPLSRAHAVSLIELIPPPHNPSYRMGLEHVGYVVGADFEAFRRRHADVLDGQQDQGPYNQPLFVVLDDQRLAKFHERSLQDVVALGGARFDGFYHVAGYPRERADQVE